MFEGEMMLWCNRPRPVEEVIADAMGADNVLVALDAIEHLLNYALDRPEVIRKAIRAKCNDIRHHYNLKPLQPAPASTANLPAASEKKGRIPEFLSTHQAEVYWQLLRDKGFIKPASYAPADGISANQATFIAALMIERLGIKKIKWKPFQELWGISHMAQKASQWKQTSILPPEHVQIARIFGYRVKEVAELLNIYG